MVGPSLVNQEKTASGTWEWNYQPRADKSNSLDNKTFIPPGPTHQFTWGSYRGDRVGVFNYNVLGENGFVDVDWFRYNSRR